MVTDESTGHRTQFADVMQFIDESDEIIGEAFRVSTDIDPHLRHLLYAPLLQRDDFQFLGVDSNIITADLKAHITQHSWTKFESRIRQFHDLVRRFEAKYIVLSYWSPIDSRRRSIVHRPLIPPEAVRQVMADAFAFYALTFAGAAEEPGQQLYSVIHYTSLRAPQKRGIATCFLDALPSLSASACLHIPPPLHDLPDALGFTEVIRDVLHSAEITTGEIEDALRRLLLNADADGTSNLNAFGCHALHEFRARLPFLSPEHRLMIEGRVNVLQAFFGDDQIDFTATAFMIATQLLWRRACPCELMYAFPTYVTNTCCVLTMGADRALAGLDVLALSSVARSLFLHPLLLDYSIKEAQAEAVRRNNVFRRFLGHNLPKIIISPVTAELENIKFALLEDDEPDVETAIAAANRIETLFEHYENLLIAFMPSERREGFFTGPVELFDFNVDVLPRVQIAFELMRSRLLSANLRKVLQLKVTAPPSCMILGHRTFLTEILFNLISNAVDSIDPIKAKTDMSRATVELGVDLPDTDHPSQFVEIRVRDQGEGFPEAELKKHRRVSERLQAARQQEFWSVVDDLLEQSVDQDAREEHMGMGIVLSMAYLRSLQWQPDIHAAGSLDVVTTEGEGSTVSIFLPLGGAAHAE